MEKTQKLKNTVVILSILCVALLAAVIFLLFPAQEPARTLEETQGTEPAQILEATQEPARRLNLTVTVEEGAFQEFSAQDLEGDWGMGYSDVKDVNILLDGESLPLDTALRQGRVTIPELAAWARLDHAEGRCHEIISSFNGISEFLYRYEDDFDLHLTYDVLEAPDGRLHKVEFCDITKPFTNSLVRTHSLRDEEGKPLAREDWGLTIDNVELTSEGITFTIHQQGGQQVGQLETWGYVLFNTEGFQQMDFGQNKMTLQMNGDSTYTLDWSDTFGTLPSGNYLLDFEVADVFDQDQIDPLRRDFETRQYYQVEFTIPEA